MKCFKLALMIAALVFSVCAIPLSDADQDSATQDVSSRLQGADRELYQQVVTVLEKDPTYNRLDYNEEQFKYVVTKCDRLADMVLIKSPSVQGQVARPHLQMVADIYSMEQYRGNLIDELTTSSAVGSKLTQVFDILKTAYEAVEDASWWGVACTLYGTYSGAQNEDILKPDELTNRAFNAVYEAYFEQRQSKNHDQAFEQVNGPWISATNTASMEAAKRYYKSLSRMVNLKWDDPALSLAVSKYLEQRYKVEKGEPLQPYEVDPRTLQGVTKFEPKLAMENLLRAAWHDTKIRLKSDLKFETDLCQKPGEETGDGTGTGGQSEKGKLVLDRVTVTAYKDYFINLLSPDEKNTHGRVVLAEPKNMPDQRHFEFDSEIGSGSKNCKSTASMDIELPREVPIVNNQFKFDLKVKASGKFSSQGYDEKADDPKAASLTLSKGLWGLNSMPSPTLEKKGTKLEEDIKNRAASYDIDSKTIPFTASDLSSDGQIVIPLSVCASWAGQKMGHDYNAVFIDLEIVYKKSAGSTGPQAAVQVRPEEVVQIIPRTDELRRAYPGLNFECQPTSLTTSVDVISLPKKIPDDKAIFLKSSSEFKGRSVSGLTDGYLVYVPRGSSQGSWAVQVTSGDSVRAKIRSSELKPTVYLVPCFKGGLSGQGWFEVMKQLQGFSIETSNLVATPKKTRFFVDATDDSSTRVAVYEGQVEVVPKNTSLSPVTVDSGQEVSVGPDSVSRVEPAGPAPDWTQAPAEGNESEGNTTGNETGVSGNTTNETGGTATSGTGAPGGSIAPGIPGPGDSSGSTAEPADNHQIGDASEVSPGSEVSQTINPAGASNFYSFHIDSSGIMKLKLEDVPEEMRSDMSIYDKNFGSIAYKAAANGGDSLTLEKDLLGPGWFYVEVRNPDGKAFDQPYSLKTSFKPAPDQYEPNPNYDRAYELKPGQTISAYICPAGDEDFYKVHVDCAGIFRIGMESVPEDMKPDIAIIDRSFSGNAAYGAAANPGDKVGLVKDVDGPGWYFIKIRDVDGKAHSDPYSLKVDFEPAPDQYEPNPNFFRAAEVAPGQSITAYICPVNDEDVYRFEVGSQGMVKISVDSVPEDMKPDISLYDRSWSSIAYASAQNPGDKVSLEKDVQGPGWYWIRIRDAGGKAFSEPYTLTLGL